MLDEIIDQSSSRSSLDDSRKFIFDALIAKVLLSRFSFSFSYTKRILSTKHCNRNSVFRNQTSEKIWEKVSERSAHAKSYFFIFLFKFFYLFKCIFCHVCITLKCL